METEKIKKTTKIAVLVMLAALTLVLLIGGLTAGTVNFMVAADVSKWGGQISEGQWAKAREDHGLEIAVVGSWHGHSSNRYANATLNAAVAAELIPATYIVLNDRDGAETITLGKTAVGDQWQNLAFVALDIELPGVTQQVITDAAMAVRADGLTPIVYTGRWFWDGHLGNPVWAKDLPLWDSVYDDHPAVELVHPYGGWTSAIAKQYHGTTQVLGFSADLSAFDRQWVLSNVSIDQTEKEKS